MAGTGLSADGLQEAFSSNPVMTVSFLSACAQPFVAYLVRLVRRHYEAGDAGYAAANLIVLLCAEMMLQSMVGIVAMAILLWRVWHRGAQAMGAGAVAAVLPAFLSTCPVRWWCWLLQVSACLRGRNWARRGSGWIGVGDPCWVLCEPKC